MLGFKSFKNARIVLAGIELIHKLKKGQYGVPYSFGTLSRMWRALETEPRPLLNGHEEGNLGHKP